MARKPKSAEVEPDKFYKVKLKAPIMIGRTALQVRDTHRIRGVHLEAVMAKIESYEEL